MQHTQLRITTHQEDEVVVAAEEENLSTKYKKVSSINTRNWMILAANIVSFMVTKPMNAERKRKLKPKKGKNRIKASCHLPNPIQQVLWTSSLTLEPLSICLTKNICYKISHLSQLAHGSFPELAILNWK